MIIFYLENKIGDLQRELMHESLCSRDVTELLVRISNLKTCLIYELKRVGQTNANSTVSSIVRPGVKITNYTPPDFSSNVIPIK